LTTLAVIDSFTFNNVTLHFHTFGHGKKTLLAFHGFGQDGTVFTNLAEALTDQYTVFAFDLFFHGKSTWPWGEQPLEKSFWKEFIQQFLHTHALRDVSVLGFSMGGKFTLATVEALPDSIQEIFLLAPDGIKTSFWYNLATYPVALRNLFKSTIHKPRRFTNLVEGAYKLRLIDKGILRFAESQMNTEEKRNRVYFSWVVFRHLKFNMTHLANLIQKNNIKLVMIIGRYDKIITQQNMNTLLSKVPDHDLELISTGHTNIIQHSIPVILKFLLTPHRF
jgi:pimeloyl-ACP methyl ester carboxylesterase